MGEFACDICGKEFDNNQKVAVHRASCEKKEAARIEKRKNRIPVGVKQYKLKSNHTTGKVGRWVNDKDGRLQRFQDGGYEFVDDPNATDSSDGLGSKKCKVVDSGTGMKAYLMEIDKDLYDEDQATKQGVLDKIDKRIKEGSFNNTLGEAGYNKDKDGKSMIRYEPE